MAGFSWSMLMPSTVAVAVLPAKSTACRVTDWFAPFSVSVTSSGQTATPASESEQVKCTFTGPTYQPPLPSWPLTIAPLIDGAVLSSLTLTESVPRLPATSNASPLTVRPAVSSWTSDVRGDGRGRRRSRRRCPSRRSAPSRRSVPLVRVRRRGERVRDHRRDVVVLERDAVRGSGCRPCRPRRT